MARSALVGAALRVAGEKLFREAEKLVAELRPSARWGTLSAADEERLARVCVVAAWFEQVYRSRRLWPGTPLSDADETVTLDRLLAAVSTYVVADIVAMTALAYGALADAHANCAPSDVYPGGVQFGVGAACRPWTGGRATTRQRCRRLSREGWCSPRLLVVLARQWRIATPAS